MARGAQALASFGRAPVLPDDGGRHGFAARALPQHRGLTLVGEADRGEVLWSRAGLRQRLLDGRELRRPDFPRVMLDPAGLREVLFELALRDGDDVAVVIEQDRAGTGGALIERQ